MRQKGQHQPPPWQAQAEPTLPWNRHGVVFPAKLVSSESHAWLALGSALPCNTPFIICKVVHDIARAANATVETRVARTAAERFRRHKDDLLCRVREQANSRSADHLDPIRRPTEHALLPQPRKKPAQLSDRHGTGHLAVICLGLWRLPRRCAASQVPDATTAHQV